MWNWNWTVHRIFVARRVFPKYKTAKCVADIHGTSGGALKDEQNVNNFYKKFIMKTLTVFACLWKLALFCLVHIHGKYWCVFVSQDYQSFFEAVEIEELYEYLKIEIPKGEVEYIIKNAPKDEVNLIWCIFIRSTFEKGKHTT